MTLIPLERRNFIHNSIEVRPSVDYVSASSFFTNFDEVPLETSGTLGGIRAIGTYSPRVKEINPYYFEDHPNNTKIKDANQKFENIQADTQAYLNTVHDLDVLCKNTWQFGIDRVQQRYMPYDINLHKKLTLKNNVYRSYLDYKGDDLIENPNWSFSNFNCINFFTIGEGDQAKTGFNDLVIHSNAIVYPNIVNDSGQQQYDFLSSGLTFSFWINPRYKQPRKLILAGQEKNAGCIINIPEFLNIYLVKGTEKDVYDTESNFRIGITTGINKSTEFGNEFSNLDLEENSNQQNPENNTFLTSDCLNFNHWHNVVITTNKSTDENTFSIEVFVDTNKICSFNNIDTNLFDSTFNKNSWICIGNKIAALPTGAQTKQDRIEEMSSTLFHSSAEGPAKEKFISAGTDRDLPSTGTNIVNLFSNSRSLSEALEAEIHDIRIYNQSLNFNKIKGVYNKGVSEIDENLIFYVPVYFIPEMIRKKTYVNAALDVVDRVADTTFDFVTNPYYFNNCGGHQLSTELFLLEWIKKSRPNIILGNRINNDYENSKIGNVTMDVEKLTDTNVSTTQPFRDSMLGKSYHEMYLSQSITSQIPNIQYDSYLYNNHLIMPCDNGLQAQYFDIVKEYFVDTHVTSSYHFLNENFNYHVYNQVFLNNSFDQNKDNDNFLLPKIGLDIENSLRSDLIIVNPGDRPRYIPVLTLDDERTIDFPHNDKVFNISNANYHDFNGGINDTTSVNKRHTLNSFGYNASDFFIEEHSESNPVVRNYSNAKIDQAGNFFIDRNVQRQLPLYRTILDPIEYHSIIFNISNQLYNRKIKKDTFSISDYDLFGTCNSIKINLKESSKGMLFRADSLTKHAEWNHVGHIFYSEGFCTVLHPSLYNFGQTNFRAKFKSENAMFVNEVNIPVLGGLHNKSHNSSFKPDIKISDSAYEQDQKFVYISEINLHDESLNIVARAKLAQPVVKRETDSLVFRLKMDY